MNSLCSIICHFKMAEPPLELATRLARRFCYDRVMLSRFFTVFAAILTLSATAADHPNVIVILTDDQGWGDLSLNGNTNLSTPHIDSLARDGAMFKRFYVCPVCSPTRAEFLTGRYHTRSGVYSTSAGGERMDLDETTIGAVLGHGAPCPRTVSTHTVSSQINSF